MEDGGRSRRSPAVRHQQNMVSEFDLPCTDCNRELVAREMPGPSASDDGLTIAECPSCGGRYYPEETLARLSVTEPT